MLQQDGFESGSLVGVSGSQVTIVNDYQGIPAISGTKMLYVPPGTSAILHLQRLGTESAVSLQARKVSECYAGQGALSLAAGAVGGTVHSGKVWKPTMQTVADAGTLHVSDIEQLGLPLFDPGKDIVVNVYGESYFGAGCASAGILIDDLKLE